MTIQLRNTNKDSFVYIENTTGSVAIGTDGDDFEILKVVTGLTGDISPGSTDASISIDPSANGDIEFRPKGIGKSTFVNGNIEIVAGNLEMPATGLNGDQGVIGFGGASTIHTYGNTNLFMGANAGNFNVALTGSSNVGIGSAVFSALEDGNGNTIVGSSSAIGLIGGDNNVGVGSSVLASLESGDNNVAIGTTALSQLVMGERNTAVGHTSLGAVLGSFNTAIGTGAGSSLVGTESSNIYLVNAGTAADANVIRIGTQGNGDAQQNTCFIAGITGVTLGAPVGTVEIDANGQLGVGTAGGGVTSSATNNTAAGTGALASITVGVAANNTAFGDSALAANTVDGNHCAVGFDALAAIDGGGLCTALGSQCLTSNTTGFWNTGVGHGAMFGLNGAAGSDYLNTSVGAESGGFMTDGANNTLLGAFAGNNNGVNGLATGSNNILIGAFAGSSYATSESTNIVIGSPGVASESAAIHIGTPGTQTTCFIAGIDGVTVTGAAVLIDAAGQMGTVPSSIRYKENVEDMGDISSDILKLRPVTFNYKKHDQDVRQVGLIAEEVHEVMPSLVIKKDDQIETVKYHELVPLLLNELIKQSKEINELKRMVASR